MHDGLESVGGAIDQLRGQVDRFAVAINAGLQGEDLLRAPNVITPQERGYASDATHVTFMDYAEVGRLAGYLGLTVEREYSFPLPRAFGKLFTYNEFIVVARKP